MTDSYKLVSRSPLLKMGKVMNEKYHSGSNDDFFVDMITELQGAETTQKTTHIN